MLRPVLLGLLVVATASCGKSTTESSAKVTPGAVAGKVLEVKGAVTVKHGAESKPLAVGDTVEGDDTIVTGADGNIVIELAHNSARWELGANKTQKVRDSIAWNAKKATAEEIDQATAAAGRPAERSAAGTVAMEGEAAMAEPAPAPAAAPAPEPKAERAKADEDKPAPPRRRVASKAASREAAPPMAPPPPPPAPADVASEEESFRPARTRGPIAKAAPPAPSAASAPAPESASASVGVAAAPPPSASVLVGAKATALHKCMTDAGMKEEVSLSVIVASDGFATVKLASKGAISAGLDKCIKGVVAGIKFVGSGKADRVLKP